MFNKTLAKTIFFALLLGLVFLGGMLCQKTITAVPLARTANEPITINAKNMPNDATTNSPVPNQPAPAKTTCIITVDGKKYDVQPLRSSHSGGDIFVCGTDMSDVFHGQHGDNLRMIQKYLVQ
jgi:hypothetical protein